MILINGGLPRSGTVLVGAILRELCLADGRTVETLNPSERRHMAELAARIGYHDGDVLLVHTHLSDAGVHAALAARGDAVVFWSHRDPRDCLVSLMRLHEMDIEDALHAMEVYLAARDGIISACEVEVLTYEGIVGDPVALVVRLAMRSGLPCDRVLAGRIAAATSPEAHAAVMRGLTADAPGVRSIRTLRRTILEDSQSLVNDRHIQSGRSGRWHRELSVEDAAHATARLAPWLDRLGYAR